MKSYLVIGMGRFGRHFAAKVTELHNEVMVVDKDEDLINELSSEFNNAYTGDCTNEAVLKGLGINNFDACVVAIGENFQSSLEITSLLKDLGAKYVVSKAKSAIQTKFLLKNGADEVVYPERDMAEKTAIKLSVNNIFDYLELTDEYSIFEIKVPLEWISRSIISLNIRQKYGVSVLAVKKKTALIPMPTADYVFESDDHALVIGKTEDVIRLTK